MLSKHSDPRILTPAGQVGACISGTMSATIVPRQSALPAALYLYSPPGSGAAGSRYKAESARPRPAATGLRPLDRVARSELTATGWTTSPAVWEWTNSCFVRISLDGERERIANTNCGVRVVEPIAPI